MEQSQSDDFYPPFPEFSAELIANCKLSNNYIPILFEWYKYVGLLCNLIGSISVIDSNKSKIHLAILKGMLNRCSRLVMASLRLASNGLYGESVRIFTRLITESAVKIEWLVTRNSVTDFNKYLAGGLKAEVKLKELIELNISTRGAKAFEIEKRMLRSIDRYMKLSGLTFEEIKTIPDVPDLASMYRDLDISDNQYVSFHRLGSQSIHGTWSDLISNYLRVDDDGNFILRDHDVIPNQNEFAGSSLIILNALTAYVKYLFDDLYLREIHVGYINDVRTEIIDIFRLTGENDFDIAESEA